MLLEVDGEVGGGGLMFGKGGNLREAEWGKE